MLNDDQLIIAKYRIYEAITLMENNRRATLPWWKRWRYRCWTLAGASAHHALSKGATYLGIFHGQNVPSKDEMKAAEKRLYDAGKVGF